MSIQKFNNKAATDVKYELKKFFMRLYEPIIGEENNILNNEKIILTYKIKYKVENKEYTTMSTESFNNIDDLVNSIVTDKRTKYLDCYFNLTTSKTENRKAEDMATRTVIGIDFDEMLTIDEVQSRFKKCGLFYNAIINSGHGIHAYICIEPTKDLKLVQEVTKKIIELVGADNKANTSTQLLRVPFTKNFKDKDDIKLVKKIYVEEEATIKRKNINKLASKLLRDVTTQENKTIKYNTNCRKLDELISNGSNEHEKHNDLLFIYGKLKQINVTKGQIQLTLDKWNSKSNYAEYEYQVKDLFKRDVFYASCEGCKYKSECYSVVENKNSIEGYEDIKYNKTVIAKTKKKESYTMNGNEILILGVLSLQGKATKKKLIEEFTYRYKDKKTKEKTITVAMSEKTLKTCLKHMVEGKILNETMNGQEKEYSIKTTKFKEENSIIISSAMLYECIKNRVSQAEMQFYFFLCYLQYNEQKKNNTRGNRRLKISQVRIAKEYGVQECVVNEYIRKFIDEKYISIIETNISENNGREYYTYALNY